ncbi:MAG: Excinuclease ABC subunit C [uncultured bacterium]|nr:MAG: Excinuclease ABC subunit C [uncultured bacterium]
MVNLIQQIKSAPNAPGVYFYRDQKNKIIYIGKAINLKNRLKSYFNNDIDDKTKQMLFVAHNISWQVTQSNLEALILEANLINKHKPHYNIRQKDDKTFIYFYLTKENFPRFFFDRPNKVSSLKLVVNNCFGPFTSASEARIAYKLLRKIFTFRDCPTTKYNLHCKKGQPCIFYNIKLCSGPCADKISKTDYNKIINSLKLFLSGKQKSLITKLKLDMKSLAKDQKFEQATLMRNQLFALNHIQDIALIRSDAHSHILVYENEYTRIEAYDISDISGQYAVGSMVVFINSKPDKNEYRKFKIKTVKGANDIAMIREVLVRRLKHNEWPMSDLMVIDGGQAHYNIAKSVLNKYNLNIPIIAVAKGPKRNKLDIYSERKMNIDYKLLEQLRNEAHRFAIRYHRKIRDKIH